MDERKYRHFTFKVSVDEEMLREDTSTKNIIEAIKEITEKMGHSGVFVDEIMEVNK